VVVHRYGAIRIKQFADSEWIVNPTISDHEAQDFIDFDFGSPPFQNPGFVAETQASIRWGDTPVPDETWSDWTPGKTGSYPPPE
jgi:hypothetical protein